MSWDDPVSQVFSHRWTGWLLDLGKVAELKVDRIKPKGFRGPIHAQLHHFADASDYGYGTVSYLRLENQDGVHLALSGPDNDHREEASSALLKVYLVAGQGRS